MMVTIRWRWHQQLLDPVIMMRGRLRSAQRVYQLLVARRSTHHHQQSLQQRRREAGEISWLIQKSVWNINCNNNWLINNYLYCSGFNISWLPPLQYSPSLEILHSPTSTRVSPMRSSWRSWETFLVTTRRSGCGAPSEYVSTRGDCSTLSQSRSPSGHDLTPMREYWRLICHWATVIIHHIIYEDFFILNISFQS